jgi:hypothetical protein
MTHLIPSQIANDIPPSVNKLPPLRSLVLFSVRRSQVISAAAVFFFVQPAILWVKELRCGPVLDLFSSRYPFVIRHSPWNELHPLALSI